MWCCKCKKTGEYGKDLMIRTNGPRSIVFICRPCATKRNQLLMLNPDYKSKARKRHLEYQKKNKYKVSARQKVHYAIRTGNLVRPKQCPSCKKKGLRIEAHHADYSKPLDVKWFCHGCHADAERKIQKL